MNWCCHNEQSPQTGPGSSTKPLHKHNSPKSLTFRVSKCNPRCFYKEKMQNGTGISNLLPCPPERHFTENSLFLKLCKIQCEERSQFLPITVSSAPVYVSVSSVTVDRLWQSIGCYISTLNIQRTLVKLISLWGFNYEEHTNGFTKFNSFVLYSPQVQAGSLRDT